MRVRLACAALVFALLAFLYITLFRDVLIGTPAPSSESAVQPGVVAEHDRIFESVLKPMIATIIEQNLSMLGEERLTNIAWSSLEVLRRGIPGNFVETGVWRGGPALLMKAALAHTGGPPRQLFLFDSYRGLPALSPAEAQLEGHMSLHMDPEGSYAFEGGVGTVRKTFAEFGLLDDSVVFVEGWFNETVPHTHPGAIALLHLDGDMYESTMVCVSHFYPLVQPHGLVVIDDYGHWPQCREAIHDYFRNTVGCMPKLNRVDYTGVWLEKPDLSDAIPAPQVRPSPSVDGVQYVRAAKVPAVSLSTKSLERKVLLYATVGGYTPVYLDMLRMMVHTALLHMGTNIHVVLLAHESWAAVPPASLKFIHSPVLLPHARFFDAGEHVEQSAQASANKLRLFSLFPRTTDFDLVVMLDVDVIVMHDLLSMVGTIEEDTLYVAKEGDLSGQYNFWTTKTFSTQQIAEFANSGRHTFNAGTFLFRPSAEIARLFDKAYMSFKANPQASLYEQGHLNTVFLQEGRLSYELTPLVGLFAYEIPRERWRDFALVHFCGAHIASSEKRVWMTGAHALSLQHSLPPVLAGLLERISNSTIESMQADANIFKGMGHIGEVKTEVMSYARAAGLEGVRHVCEIGFNAGHSMAVALLSNPDATGTVFDRAELPWSAQAFESIRNLFPNRVRFIKGDSETTLPEYLHAVREEGAPTCDLMFVDGDHSAEGAYRDFLNARAVASPGGLVFADDLSASFPGAEQSWAAARAEGVLEQLYCYTDPMVYLTYHKAWCLGRFLPHARPA